MPFCPVCREEYRPGFTHCADCDELLVDSLPPEPYVEKTYVDEAEAVLLCALTDEFRALMIETTLQDQGIPVLVKTGGAGRFFAENCGYSGELREIYVPAYLSGEAGDILEGMTLDERMLSPADDAAPDEAGIDDPGRPYKITEDKRIKLSIIFGLITLAYIVYLYYTTGSAGV